VPPQGGGRESWEVPGGGLGVSGSAGPHPHSGKARRWQSTHENDKSTAMLALL